MISVALSQGSNDYIITGEVHCRSQHSTISHSINVSPFIFLRLIDIPVLGSAPLRAELPRAPLCVHVPSCMSLEFALEGRLVGHRSYTYFYGLCGTASVGMALGNKVLSGLGG